MTLIVEDGTGLSTAQTMASLSVADAYHYVRANSLWEDADFSEKEAALVKASAALSDESRYPWVGVKAFGYTQRMPWPRSDATEADGTVVPANVVPWRVADAVCALAGLVIAGTDLQPTLARGGRVTSEAVGAVRITYADDAPGGEQFSVADGLVSPLLRNRPKLAGVPLWCGGDGAAFSLGMHE